MAEVIVIGAGVAGLGIAWQLARAGREVLVIEREHAGGGAAGAAAGMLAPTAEVRFEEEALLALGQHSLALYPELVAQLEHDAGLRVDYRREGTLVIALDRDDAEALDHLHVYQRRLGLDVARLSATQAREHEPGLDPKVHSALWCPTDHQVDPRALVAALRAALIARGGALREGATVASIWHEAGRVCGVTLEDGARLRAPLVLVAAGAWTRALGLGLLPGTLPHIRPVRGQMLALQMDPDAPLCRHVVRAPDAYLVPKSDGRLIIGATSEEMGFDPRLTAGGLFELLRGAWEAMPGIYDLPVLETWTGFRPVSLTNTPILGPSPKLDGLWLACGQGRNGILLTAAIALEVSRAILTGRTPDSIAAFSPR